MTSRKFNPTLTPQRPLSHKYGCFTFTFITSTRKVITPPPPIYVTEVDVKSEQDH